MLRERFLAPVLMVGWHPACETPAAAAAAAAAVSHDPIWSNCEDGLVKHKQRVAVKKMF